MQSKSHLFQPGQSGNPNGRPKGATNRLPSLVVKKVMDVWKELEETEGKRLIDIAQENPVWFYEKFIRYLLPKNLDIGLFIGEHFSEEDLASLPDDTLLKIVKGAVANKTRTRKKPLKKVKGKVVKKKTAA